jgi:hypothetical protein
VASRTRSALRWSALALGAAAGAYAAYATVAWLRYGHPGPASGDARAERLDRFMPVYDIVERHHVRVVAPPEIALAAAAEMDLFESPVVRAIFRAREKLLGSEPDTETRPRGLLAVTKSLGWGVLDEAPGREIVMGAVTQPWEADVVFRPLAPEAFAPFDEPGYVKIAWTLRADPAGPGQSIFRTETRAVATDAAARAKFRRYWSMLSPGIIAIRWLMLAPVKKEAERRAREAPPAAAPSEVLGAGGGQR